MKKQYIKPVIRIPELEMEFLLNGPSKGNGDGWNKSSNGQKSFSLTGSAEDEESRNWLIEEDVNKKGNDLTWGDY